MKAELREPWENKLARRNKQHQEYKNRHPDKGLNSHLKRTYGITLEEYNRLFAEQNGRCAICGISQLELTKRLCVDHDHETGKVRGLICNMCNGGLGYFKDSLTSLEKAVEYLKAHDIKHP